jgi:carbon storage regulator
MLVLSRPCESKICIGPDITVKVLGIRKRQVTLGIEAPREISIWREEVLSAAGCGQHGVEQRTLRRQQSCLAKSHRRHS